MGLVLTLQLLLSSLLCARPYAFIPPSIAPVPSSGVNARQRTELHTTSVTAPANAPHNSHAGPPSTVTTRDLLSLDSIREGLIRQEDSIIFALIERAQFRQNSDAIYKSKKFKLQQQPGSDEALGQEASFLEYVLLQTEVVHASVRRYCSPEEHPFFPSYLPEPMLPALDFPQILAPNTVNLNNEIMARYIEEIVPSIAGGGDDEQHGSSVLCDITALQALSRRVHFGKFVAESKFQESEEKYRSLCKAGDARGVNELLTNSAVEKQVCKRSAIKASTFGQDIDSTGQKGAHLMTSSPLTLAADPSLSSGLSSLSPLSSSLSSHVNPSQLEPEIMAGIYRDFIIPLTKDVEILYLFERTG
ncbi:unnamed protein product [Chrysoparadoxa australica]